MYTIQYVSVRDGTTQSYRLSALSLKEALDKFAKVFPNVKVLSCSPERS